VLPSDHYVPEEAPAEIVEEVTGWLARLDR